KGRAIKTDFQVMRVKALEGCFIHERLGGNIGSGRGGLHLAVAGISNVHEQSLAVLTHGNIHLHVNLNITLTFITLIYVTALLFHDRYLVTLYSSEPPLPSCILRVDHAFCHVYQLFKLISDKLLIFEVESAIPGLSGHFAYTLLNTANAIEQTILL